MHIRNVSLSKETVDDLGLVWAPGDSLTLEEMGGDLSELSSSVDLHNKVRTGVFIVNDDHTDLSPSDGLKFITIESVLDDEKPDSGGNATSILGRPIAPLPTGSSQKNMTYDPASETMIFTPPVEGGITEEEATEISIIYAIALGS